MIDWWSGWMGWGLWALGDAGLVIAGAVTIGFIAFLRLTDRWGK